MPFPTFDDLFDRGEREIISLNPEIDPAQIRTTGSDANITVSAAATMGEQLSKACTEEQAGLFFGSATDEKLTKLGYDKYQLPRFDAVSSRGTLTFYRQTSTAGNVTIPRLFSCRDNGGGSYGTIEEVTITGTTPINARALSNQTGLRSNAMAGVISTLSSSLSDTSIKVTNAIALAKFTRAAGGTTPKIPYETEIQDIYGTSYLTAEELAFTTDQLVGYVPVKPKSASNGYDIAPLEASTLSTIVSTLTETFTVSNAVKTGGAFSGGDDQEQDDVYKQRCQLFLHARRAGTIPAIEYGALSFGGVRFAHAWADTAQVNYIGSTLTVELPVTHCVVADVNGIGSDAMVAGVLETLDEYKTGGQNVFVTGGTALKQDVTLQLSKKVGYDWSLISSEASNQVNSILNAMPPSIGVDDPGNRGILWLSAITDALRRIPGVVIPYNAITYPVADVVPALGISLRPGTITITAV